MESAILVELKTQIEKHEPSDYKCFIAQRSPKNHAQYSATIAVIVPIIKGEAVLKEIMQFTPKVNFKGSEVETSDERGVDILTFETTLFYHNADFIEDDTP